MDSEKPEVGMDTLRDIPGYEGRYAITDDGRVFSHAKNQSLRGTRGGRSHSGIWLKQRPNLRGYYCVGLCTEDSVLKLALVHRLVAIAWIPNPLHLPQVNHLSGDKTDNRFTNLEWCTCLENIRHSVSQKRHAHGERHGAAKLTVQDVIEIKASRVNGSTWTGLSEKFGVSRYAVRAAATGKTWKELK